MKKNNNIPTYSLGEFTTSNQYSQHYQVEVFDANRHFQVQYPHRHDFYEVLFLTQGSGFHIIDSNKYFIKPPSIFFLSPGQAHKLELSHDIQGYIFLFKAEFYLLNQANKNKLLELPFFFAVDQDNPPLLLKNNEDINFFVGLFKRGCNEMAKDNGELIRSILDLILQTCNQLYPADTFGIQKSRGHLLVKNLLRLIEESYQKNLSINEYAEKLSITPNHLTQMVKQVTGKTSARILQDKVILETKRLLIHTDMTVTEIADYMNFSDQSYFTKFFKKACDITPLQYRKSKQ